MNWKGLTAILATPIILAGMATARSETTTRIDSDNIMHHDARTLEMTEHLYPTYLKDTNHDGEADRKEQYAFCFRGGGSTTLVSNPTKEEKTRFRKARTEYLTKKE